MAPDSQPDSEPEADSVMAWRSWRRAPGRRARGPRPAACSFPPPFDDPSSPSVDRGRSVRAHRC